jgi:hypothetical protein
MAKDKLQVDFYGKKMNWLEAKLFSCGLRMEIINITLTAEDFEKYSIWKEQKELSNKMAGEKMFRKTDEKYYIIEELKKQIKATKNGRKREYCQEHGHKEIKGSAKIEYGQVQVLCSRCNSLYKRNLTQKELQMASKVVYNPFRG